MQPLPAPCPADLIPDATGMAAFEAAYRQAKEQDAVFVAVESLGEHWTVKADMITAPQYAVADSVYDAIRAAVIQMIRAGEIRSDSSAGPAYFVLHNVAAESRATPGQASGGGRRCARGETRRRVGPDVQPHHRPTGSARAARWRALRRVSRSTSSS
ncbi:hypothetical protein [Streptomyces sp. NPDC001851]|uniref:hypothetical protein n=1 Tax=Streptomyces sp. NPDC001851 TaxID=3154529 RepID=UPI0033253871